MSILRVVVCFTLAAIAFCADTAPGQPLIALKDLDTKEIKLGEDEEGCKDSALMPRIAGCSIIQCGTKEMDTLELVTAATPDGALQKEAADGPSEVIYYLCPGKTAPAAIVKQAEAALVKAGYKAVFKGEDDEDHPLLTAQKGDEYVQISTYVYQSYSAYVQTAIKVVEAPVPPATADVILDELTTVGKTVLNGLTFDGAAPTADGEKILAELQNVLEVKPAFKVRLDVHTEAGTDPKVQQELSEKRGEALASWLAARGIDQARITVQGFGDTKAAEGCARVEAVKLP